MNRMHVRTLFCAAVLSIAVIGVGSLDAQVGKSLGLVDINVAAERDLLAMPGMNAAIVKSIIDKRPFASATELNAHLLAQGLTAAQAMALYDKAFVPVNLNTATREEFLLIPNAGTRMAREFDEYRPWRTWAQFDREISKYVGQPATDKFKQYFFIPMNVNTASDADLMTIPGVTAATVAQIKAARPVSSKEQFETQVGRTAGAKEAGRLWRFFVLQ
jgi:DNA uptake protein ComE-like DNA-binding protein